MFKTKMQTNAGCKKTAIFIITLLLFGLCPYFPAASAAMPFSSKNYEYEFKLAAGYAVATEYSNTNETWRCAGYTDGWVPPSGSSGCKPLADSVQFNFEVIGNWVAIGLNIPAGGRYSADLTYRVARSGAVAEIYFMPATEDIAGALASAVPIEEVRFDNSTGDYPRYASLPDFEVSIPGEHLLIFKCKAGGAWAGTFIYPGTLTLDGVVPETVSFSLEETVLNVGESAGSEVEVLMNDGEQADLNALTVNYSSSNTAVAVVDNEGVVTAVAPGSADITVTVITDRVEISDTQIVIVNPVEETLLTSGTIRVTATDTSSGAAIAGAVTSDVPEFEMNVSNNLAFGREIAINAAEMPGKTFKYWKDVPSKRIVSVSMSYKFKVGSNTYLTAVYSEPESGQYLINFIDRNGEVLKSNYLNENAPISKPENLFATGYTFAGWSPSVPELAFDNGVYVAQYSAEAPSYILTTIGPVTVEEGNNSPYAFNQEILLNVDEALIPADQKFICWRRDGNIISYEDSYRFYMWDETTVEAVCAPTATEVSAVPQLFMDSVKPSASRFIVSSERMLPLGFDLIETGIIMKQSSATAETLKLFGGSYDVKAVAQSPCANGQFTARRDNASGRWYARAYMIYRSGSEIKVIYSDIAEATV